MTKPNATHQEDISLQVDGPHDIGERLRVMSDYEENASQIDFEKGWYDCEVIVFFPFSLYWFRFFCIYKAKFLRKIAMKGSLSGSLLIDLFGAFVHSLPFLLVRARKNE